MSLSRFFDCFKKTFGMSPMQWVRRERINRACRLLADSRRNIAEVAEATGFANPYHFSRVFTSITGQTPGAFRHAISAERPVGTALRW